MRKLGKTRLWLGLGGMILTLLRVEPARALNFDSALLTAADVIAGAIEHAHKKKVAVIDFDQTEGQVTALGRFLAEEISADLAEHPRPFAVLDQANLQSILTEHNLTMSGLANPENAKRLGEIAGVDALVLGTYTDLGETYRLSLRVISTNSAEVVASERTNVPKTTALVQLAAKVLDQPDLANKAPGGSRVSFAGARRFFPATRDAPPLPYQRRLRSLRLPRSLVAERTTVRPGGRSPARPFGTPPSGSSPATRSRSTRTRWRPYASGRFRRRWPARSAA